MIRTIIFLISLVIVTNCKAQEKITEHVYKLSGNHTEHQSGAATISDFRMLEGHWTGTGLGAQVDELWMPARANQMHGIFRMEENGKIVFTEYLTILEDSISFLMKVKHFSPDFEGWEEKKEAIDFRFIKRENNTLYFSGLTAIRKEEDHLDIYVAFKHNDGSRTEEVFAFTKNNQTHDK